MNKPETERGTKRETRKIAAQSKPAFHIAFTFNYARLDTIDHTWLRRDATLKVLLYISLTYISLCAVCSVLSLYILVSSIGLCLLFTSFLAFSFCDWTNRMSEYIVKIRWKRFCCLSGGMLFSRCCCRRLNFPAGFSLFRENSIPFFKAYNHSK